ncbi:hypothetical protein CBR_g41357 [Chara braunii]|uniref:Acyltransferase n=1 Tax=Chara braunii TaxID=69332 RepID=A0A388LVX3_CHABU|nr:hypothetical protein CBR_g41357 [Chara braunii]|eukprot:GBG86362.1 hypothetical protein CBR_g41357 [Chara braunii]
MGAFAEEGIGEGEVSEEEPMGAFAEEGIGEGEVSEEEPVMMLKERRVEGSQRGPSRTSAQDSSGNTTDGDDASLDAYPADRCHTGSAGLELKREEGVGGCSVDAHPSYRSDRSAGIKAEREGGGSGCCFLNLNCDEAGDVDGDVDGDGFTTTTSSTRRRHVVNGSARSPVDGLLREDVKKMQSEDGGKGGIVGKQDEKAAAAVRFFCKPYSTTLFDVLIVFMCHLFPFSVFAAISEILLLKWAVGKYGSIVLTIFFSFSLLLIAIPGYYIPSVRVVLRCLYVPLARYVKSMAFIVSTDLAVSSSSPSVSSSSTSVNESCHKFEDKRSLIFAIHPHGRVFYTPTMLAQLHDVWHEGALGRKNDLFIGASSGFFYVPVLRNLLYAVGVIPVSKSSVVRKLRAGNDVIIVVGGIKEVSLGTSDHEDVLYLVRRKGFIKLAIEENVGVVPVYCFNENSLFKHDPKWFLKFWEKVNRLIVIGVPLFRGVWNTPMPYRRNILVAFGEPMFAKEGESTDAFHARYMQELKNLYHKHVALSGRPDHKLVIV